MQLYFRKTVINNDDNKSRLHAFLLDKKLETIYILHCREQAVNYLRDPKDGETTRPFSRAWTKPANPSSSSGSGSSRASKEEKGKTGKGLKAKNKNPKDKQPSDSQRSSKKRPLAADEKEGKSVA